MSTIERINELYSNYGYSSNITSKLNINEYSVNIFIVIFILLVCLFVNCSFFNVMMHIMFFFNYSRIYELLQL